MTLMTWFYLALLAPLLASVVTLLDDNLLSFVYKSPYVACISVGFFGALPLLTRPFIHANVLPANLALLAALAGFLTLGYYFFYFKALSVENPSVVVALFILAPATLPFLAYALVHERLNGLEIAGFAVILFASLAFAVTDIRRFKFSRALLYVVIAVALVDVVSLTSKYVYERSDFYSAYLYFSTGVGIAGVVSFLMKRRENVQTIKTIAKSIKRLWPVFIAAEVIGLAAELCTNLAISRGPVSLVMVVQGIQPVFVLVIALALFSFAPQFFREAKEMGVVKKLGLMMLMLVGLALINFASPV